MVRFIVLNFLLWTPGLDPGSGVHYSPPPYCTDGAGNDGNPYTYDSLADPYSFHTLGPIC